MQNDTQGQSGATAEQGKSLKAKSTGTKESGWTSNPNDDICGEPEYIKLERNMDDEDLLIRRC